MTVRLSLHFRIIILHSAIFTSGKSNRLITSKTSCRVLVTGVENKEVPWRRHSRTGVTSSGLVVKRSRDTDLVILTHHMSTKSKPTKECKSRFIHCIVVRASKYEQPRGPKLNITHTLLSLTHTVKCGVHACAGEVLNTGRGDCSY